MKSRLFACLMAVLVLGAVSPATDAATEPGPAPRVAAQNVPAKALDARAEVRLINQKMRELGFSFSRIERVEGGHVVHVVGFRARTTALEQRGEFRSFAVRAQVADGQVVLDKGDLEGAGIIVIDGRPLADRGIRIEAVRAIVKVPGQPVSPDTARVKPGPATSVKSSVLGSSRSLKRGLLRWAPLSMAPPAPDRTVQPPAPGQAVGIMVPERAISFDQSVLIVNKRPALTFSPFRVLDPTKETPTPIEDPAGLLPAFDSGERMTAEEYYRDLNALEQEFNALGYSLDSERDPAEEILLQEVPRPPLQNGVGIKMNWKPREGIRLRSESFGSAVRTKQERLAALKKATAATTQEATTPGTAKPVPSKKDRLFDKPALPFDTPRPFSRALNPPAVERGSKSTFSVTLLSRGDLKGDPDKLEITNGASASAYVFNNEIRLIEVTGKTLAPVRKGDLAVSLDVMVLGQHVAVAPFPQSVPVPDVALSDMSSLPSGLPTAGNAADWAKSIDVGYGFTFMAGPIPLSVRIGTRAAVGVEYALLASPVRVDNEVVPHAAADVYAQAGVNIAIAGAGVECRLRLLDGRLTVHGMLMRGAEDGREFLETEYAINRWYRALDGSLSLYAWIYVPRWGIPPWKKKTFRTELAGWSGFSGDVWEPHLTKAKHELYNYAKPAIRGIRY